MLKKKEELPPKPPLAKAIRSPLKQREKVEDKALEKKKIEMKDVST
jgi:hypothetical protein